MRTMTDLEHLISILRHSGRRITPQRRAICRILSETDTHPTAAKIYEVLKAEMPSLSLMTVYNTLNTLVELGAIHTIGQAGDDTVHYDTHTEPHVNVVCVACHNIFDIPSEKIELLKRDIEEKSGYCQLSSRIIIEGLCPNCQKIQKTNHP